MALLGSAALAMWWDMAPEMRPDFEDWHSHEHFPERLGIPGFRRASRWRSATGGEGFFVLYELEDWGILSSTHYLASLNQPTPWSTRMMPHHRNMVRSQCRVLESRGGAVAGHALTLRLSPAPGRDDALRASLKDLIGALAQRPGHVGMHLLQHQAPPIAATTEQKIRGGDKFADWVLVAFAYELQVLEALVESELGDVAMVARGAVAGSTSGLYSLSHSATAGDIA
ncbi:MAG: hypothetical protein ACAH21_11525 [Ramlibacter sp.]